jgi:hypothetical protein
MFDDDRLTYSAVPEMTYEMFKEKASQSKELLHKEEFWITLCNELYAMLYHRIAFNDKMLYEYSGSRFTADEICVVGKHIQKEFIGISHFYDNTSSGLVINPLDSFKLLAGIESFLSNSLNVNKAYEESAYDMSVVSRNGEMVLMLKYKHDLKTSYLDKYHCRFIANILRNIQNTSVYRYY